ncbi:MAG: peptidoglycan DD-metalloendopeptidase family protein, partial [Synergistaceae bacterium]|nr:peptidoglycan DD-metalloendopeptidase family protein [Synergistaceae bacterium]
PYQALTAFSPFAVNSIPQFVDVDLGDQKLTQYRIPLTGENRTVGQYRVGINPEKRLDADARERIAQIAANASTRNANIGAQADIYGHDTRNEIEMRKNELELRKLQIENIDSQIERLQKEADADDENVRNSLTGNKKQDEIIWQEYSKRSEARKAQIQELQKAKNEHFAGNKNWIPADLFGEGRRTTSSYGIRNDPFTGEKKNHRAIDYGFAEGEPIPLDPRLGETFRVIESRKSKSYGNTVIVEAGTTPDGRPITMRFAHMSDKSRQLKPGDVLKAGDIIGNAGSTGRATGPHLHFEVMIDGVQVDPNEFFKMRAQMQSQTQPQTQTRAASPQERFFDTVRGNVEAPIKAKKQREAVNNAALGIADRGNPQITALGGPTNIPPEAVLIAPNGLSWITAEEILAAARNEGTSAEMVVAKLLGNGFMYPDELGGAEQSQSVEQPQQTQAEQTQTENQNPTLWTDLKYFGGKVKNFVNSIPNSPSYQDYAHDAYSQQYRGKTEAQANFEKLTSGDLSAITPDMNRAYQPMNRAYQPNASQLRNLSPISDIGWTGNEWLRDLQLRNLPEIIAQYRDKNRSNSGEKLPLNFTYPFATPLDIRQRLVDPFAFPPNGYFMYR